MTLRVAITGISGDAGRGAIYGLRQNPPGAERIWILGLDASIDPPNKSSVDCFVQLPLVREGDYVAALIAALQLHRIDVLLPSIDSEIAVLSAARQKLASIATKVTLAPSDLVEVADDKLRTAQFLSARGVGAPATCNADAPTDIGFPLIAKPRRGHGSQGVAFISDRAALQGFLEMRPQNYCLQRHIEGTEITAGFLYDFGGMMRDAIAMERVLENGRTVRARVLNDPAMIQFMNDFATKVSGIGAINAQLRWHAKEGPMVFEINARLSGSTEMRVAVGFNDPLRLAQHFGRGTPIVPARPFSAIVYRSGADLSVEPC
jgi:carbamoyl-phosphate synthase large subunit